MTTTAKADRKPASLSFPVPGELGAILREAGYDAELVVRRADGRDPMPSEDDVLPMVLGAVEASEATGRACGVSLRAEVSARSVATGPANGNRVKTVTSPRAAKVAGTRAR